VAGRRASSPIEAPLELVQQEQAHVIDGSVVHPERMIDDPQQQQEVDEEVGDERQDPDRLIDRVDLW
jgi:hypothetical protein